MLIDYVYFIDHGIASVVADGSARGGIEIGIIGREGVTGLAVLMGADRSPHETYMQLGGAGRRISAASLREVMSQSQSLHSVLLRHGYAFSVQMAQTALANGRHKLEERLARWLLMAHDRVDGDELPLTHEFLSVMLGVRRSGVTVALKILEREGMVNARRGWISIIDREGLGECANGAYHSPKRSFAASRSQFLRCCGRNRKHISVSERAQARAAALATDENCRIALTRYVFVPNCRCLDPFVASRIGR